ncbi:hypothetical protein ACN38_g9749 [Penicillium nordicum]|uniref:Uncharacterized protein n=1 Tax=Penicillium nordicum TaxID=229535 RepID=A0A0M8NV56_9EURO|nr:hypothetical protein ACN38_g9749 [Penicillium nordicum]
MTGQTDELWTQGSDELCSLCEEINRMEYLRLSNKFALFVSEKKHLLHWKFTLRRRIPSLDPILTIHTTSIYTYGT